LECEYIRKKYGTRWKDSCGIVTQDENGLKIFSKFEKIDIFKKSLYGHMVLGISFLEGE